MLNGRERLIYERALAAVRPTGLDLDILVMDAVAARTTLKGVPLTEAARFHVEHTAIRNALRDLQVPAHSFFNEEELDGNPKELAVLSPPHMKQPLGEVHLVPAERGQLAHAEGVAVGDPDHSSIPVPVPTDLLRGLSQLFDLCRGQKLPAPPLGVGALAGRFG